MALTWLRNREVFGPTKSNFGDHSRIYTSLYSSVAPHKRDSNDYGGIFGLEFSPDGWVSTVCSLLCSALSLCTQVKVFSFASTLHFHHEKHARHTRKTDSVSVQKRLDIVRHGVCAQVQRDLRHLSPACRCGAFSFYPPNKLFSNQSVLRLSRGNGEVKTFIIWHCLESKLQADFMVHKAIFTSYRKLNRSASCCCGKRSCVEQTSLGNTFN